MFPISKYKFFVTPDQSKVIAVSTYAGKTVKGVAKRDPRDTFDLHFGKELAAARCALKVAKKRKARAHKKAWEAECKLMEAQKHYHRMCNYDVDAFSEYNEAVSNLEKLEARG